MSEFWCQWLVALDLLEIDCSQNKLRLLEERQGNNPALSDYSKKWKFIAPESTPEIIYDSVCLDE